MNFPIAAGFAPADTPPAPKSARDSQDPNCANDLFGDLLRGQLNATPPAPTPASDSRDTPPPASISHDDDNAQAANSSSDSASSASSQQSSDASKDSQKTPAANPDRKNPGKTGDKDGDKADTDKKDAATPQTVAVPTAVAAVIAALTDTAPPAATQTDGTDAGTPAAPAVPAAAQAMPPAPAAEAIPAPPAPGKGDQDGKSDKPGTGPFNAQVSVTDDSKSLVSRPQAALAPVQPADAPAHDDNKSQAADNQAPAPAPTTADGTKPDTIAAAKPANTDKTDSQQTGDAAGPVLVHADSGAPSHKGAADPAAQSQPQVAANTAPAVLPVHGNTPSDPASQIQNLINAPRAAAIPTASSTTFDQVAVQITKAAADGLDKISIQLKPESLGRIDVQLQVTHDGRVNATIGAHRQDTLDLLQRDSRSLERALNDAGLRADAGSLSFNLSGQGNDGTAASYTPSAPTTIAGGTELDPIAAVNAAALASDSAAARGGIDIRV